MATCYRTFDDPEETAEHADFDHEAGIDAEYIADLPGAGRHFTYMLFGATPGVCPYEAAAPIYVGVTSNLRAQMRAHSKKWWWSCVLRDRVELVEHQTRADAEDWERRMIADENPDLNVALGVGRKLSSLVVER